MLIGSSNINAFQILILFVGIILTNEIIFRINLPKRFFILTKLISKLLKLLRSSFISNIWKEKVIPIYSLRLLVYSFVSLIIILFISFPFLGSIFLIANDYEKFLEVILDPTILIFTLTVSIIYMSLRIKLYG